MFFCRYLVLTEGLFYTFQFSGDLDFQNVIDTFITENKAEQNPTLILKRMQEIFVEGRPLEITDEGVCPEGETSLLLTDKISGKLAVTS